MALDRTKLQRIGPQNSNSPTIWTYATSDALTDVDASGYFNGAADLLQAGDWILISSTSTYGIQIVKTNTRDLTASPPVTGVVNTSNALAAGTIDSD